MICILTSRSRYLMRECSVSPSVGRPATPEAPFSARLFLQRRYSDAWSVIDDGASTRCPDTPDGVESIDDEDETLIADDEQHQEEQGDGEWEYIGKNEVREVCDEEAEMAKKPTGTQTDGLLVGAPQTWPESRRLMLMYNSRRISAMHSPASALTFPSTSPGTSSSLVCHRSSSSSLGSSIKFPTSRDEQRLYDRISHGPVTVRKDG